MANICLLALFAVVTVIASAGIPHRLGGSLWSGLLLGIPVACAVGACMLSCVAWTLGHVSTRAEAFFWRVLVGCSVTLVLPLVVGCLDSRVASGPVLSGVLATVLNNGFSLLAALVIVLVLCAWPFYLRPMYAPLHWEAPSYREASRPHQRYNGGRQHKAEPKERRPTPAPQNSDPLPASENENAGEISAPIAAVFGAVVLVALLAGWKSSSEYPVEPLRSAVAAPGVGLTTGCSVVGPATTSPALATPPAATPQNADSWPTSVQADAPLKRTDSRAATPRKARAPP